MNRTTSTYTLDIQTDVPNEVTDLLLERCPVPVAASGVDKRRAFIRFRAKNDEEAADVADQLTDLPGTLHTGYGIHNRVVVR
jgi:hypothetical protein